MQQQSHATKNETANVTFDEAVTESLKPATLPLRSDVELLAYDLWRQRDVLTALQMKTGFRLRRFSAHRSQDPSDDSPTNVGADVLTHELCL